MDTTPGGRTIMMMTTSSQCSGTVSAKLCSAAHAGFVQRSVGVHGLGHALE